MKLCTETVTLRLPYPNDGNVAYQEYVISGVSWYQQASSSITSNGTISSDGIVVRIPINAPGLPYEDYSTWVSDALRSGKWSMHEGATLLHAGKTVVVKAFNLNTRGRAPHIKVVCG